MKQTSKLTTALILSFSLPAFFAGNAIAAKGGHLTDTEDVIVSTTDDDDSINDDDSVNDTDADTPLDATEASHLIFMREEEKLARDVYLSFAERYP